MFFFILTNLFISLLLHHKDTNKEKNPINERNIEQPKQHLYAIPKMRRKNEDAITSSKSQEPLCSNLEHRSKTAYEP